MNVTLDSVALLLLCRKRCQNFLVNENDSVSEGELAEFFIHLHLVLELGINGFFRMYHRFVSGFAYDGVDSHMDRVDFLSKVIIFLHSNGFGYHERRHGAKKHQYLSIVGAIKHFNSIRNSLVHGHTIATYKNAGIEKSSFTKSTLNTQLIELQVGKFKLIVNGLADCLRLTKSPIDDSGKEQLIDQFLDTSFLYQ